MTRSSVAFCACILAVAVGALALRLPRLDVRPMHGDEGNQAVKAGILLETGSYVYDPHDHHGPTLYYLSLLPAWLTSEKTAADLTESTLRTVPVAFGVGLVLLVLLAGDGLGLAAAVCAAILTALSPAMVFYSRYYIQEMLLVFFTFGAIVCGWRYTRGGRPVWAVLCAACLALMFVTKETWVFAAAAMVAGVALETAWARLIDRRPIALRPYLNIRHLAAGAGVFVVVWLALFSSFFTNWSGLTDSLLAYWNFLFRAGGAGLHDKPRDYYLAMLAFSRWVTESRSGPWWSEALILALALVGAMAALTGRGIGAGQKPLGRFLVFYTIVLTVLYALVPYKTPWCTLSFLHGFILLAGIGVVALVRWVRVRLLQVAVCVVLAALAAQLGWQAYLASYRYPADLRNPYVYAHTSTDALNLVKRVEEIAAVSPDGLNLIVQVITPENFWPLPWYLRQFPRVGWWHEMPENPDADVIITSDFEKELDARLRGKYNRMSMFGIRPGVVLTVYVRDDLWQAFLDRQRDARPSPSGKGAS